MFCEDKLPESTGDKLTAWGDGFQLSWGTRLDSPGEVLNCIGGSDSTECLIYLRGTIFRPRLSGMLVKNTCILLGNVETCRRIHNFLKADSITMLGGEYMDFLTYSLGN